MKVEKIHFEEQLAQVIYDDSRDALAIELRDKESRSLKLIYLDLQSGKHWKIDKEVNWWQQLQACSQGNLVLNGFEDPSLPMSSGIYVYEAESGHKLWEQPSQQFLYTAPGGLWVEEKEKKIFVNWKAGSSIKAPPEEVQKAYELNIQSAYHACRVIYPLYDEFPALQKKAKTVFGHTIEEHLDYLKLGDREIFSYPLKNPKGGWDQEMGVLKGEGLELHRKTASQLKGIAWSTFFIWRKFLIWQEGYRSLCFSDLG